MKAKFYLLIVSIGSAIALTYGQGTFTYDQQSSTDETPFPGTGGVIQQIALPWGQSFTPGLTGINFIRLKFSDANPVDGLGATVFLNLRSDSISGSTIGSTLPVFMPNNFAGTADFSFPSLISLNPDVTYYFEPVVQAGGLWRIDGGEYNYPRGNVFANGLPQSGSDLWFREGIVVPEPGVWAVLVLGLGLLTWRKRCFS